MGSNPIISALCKSRQVRQLTRSPVPAGILFAYNGAFQKKHILSKILPCSTNCNTKADHTMVSRRQEHNGPESLLRSSLICCIISAASVLGKSAATHRQCLGSHIDHPGEHLAADAVFNFFIAHDMIAFRALILPQAKPPAPTCFLHPVCYNVFIHT